MSRYANLLTTEKDAERIIPLEVITEESLAELPEAKKAWAEANGFSADTEGLCRIPDGNGTISKILVSLGGTSPSATTPWWLAGACEQLAVGTYTIEGIADPAVLTAAAFGWCLAHYSYDRYRSDKEPMKERVLILPDSVDIEAVLREAEAYALVRDLVNTPTDDLGPADLQAAIEELAATHSATCTAIIGDDLLKENFPAIHTVGRAAAEGREPRLIELNWGDETNPALTLVGKGVCYDTGGLDIKPGSSMRLMKKDMGGAANAIGLASMIMAAELPVRLRLLVPAVENAVAGNSYRPGDIVRTRKGLTVEIGNTDAEGRVILCDALALACEDAPDLLLDFATLTGAARVALGPDLPAVMTNDDTLWNALEKAANETGDPIWRLPLWAPYDKKLNSKVADLNNITEGFAFAGAITAGLYLQRFVSEGIKWAHTDLVAWQFETLPGQQAGGAAQSIRATFAAIKKLLHSASQ